MAGAARLLPLLLLLASHAFLSSAAPVPPKRIFLTVQANAQRRRARAAAAASSANSLGLLSQFRGATSGLFSSGAATPAATGPIKYWGGPVVVGNPTVNVYHIYYGSWPSGSGQDYINNFVTSLSSDSGAQGASSDPTVKGWWAISANYYESNNAGKKNVSSKVRLAGTTYDSYSYGKALSDSNVLSIIKNKIGSGKPFAYDPHGIYVLLTSKDVTLSSGFCTKYCGWHTYGYVGSSPFYYAFVGHHGKCPTSCGAKSVSPNGNPAIDATISTLAHEISEAATDPDVRSGWFDSNGEENADLCSWSYGTTRTTSNGALYNMVGLNGMKFLVQQNWDRQLQKCVGQNAVPGGTTPSPPPPSPPPPPGTTKMNCQCTCASGSSPMNCQCSCTQVA
ncbi:hypothetical protein CLOM_g20631 [Closterium sp. NIES-68]|nr:hypothetical protein CLOM_g20631 [Closterium sp. NIES-68]GJP66880.1 hypothetical protein CLOP_g23762 [Closterium sp. NIES-67]